MATPLDLKKKHYSTLVSRLEGIKTDNPRLLTFQQNFNDRLFMVSPKTYAIVLTLIFWSENIRFERM